MMAETERQRHSREEMDRVLVKSRWAKAAWLAAVFAGLAFPTTTVVAGPHDFVMHPLGVFRVITYCVAFGFLFFVAVMTTRVTRLCLREPHMRRHRIWLAIFIVGLLLLDVSLPVVGPVLLGMTRDQSIGLAIVAFLFVWIVAFATSVFVWSVEAERDEEMA